MSYLVLALGFILSLCGAFAIDAGYGIIQVERGWASVIAGSMALSCGIVTLALGLILHRLSSMHALLKSGQGAMPLVPGYSPAITPEASKGGPAVAPLSAPPSPAMASGAVSRLWPQRSTRSHLAAARNFWKSRGPLVPSARGAPEPDHAAPKAPPLAREGSKMMQTPAEAASETSFAVLAGAAVEMAEDRAGARPAFAPAEETPADLGWREDEEPGLFDEERAEDEADKPQAGRAVPEPSYAPGEPEAKSEPSLSWPAETASIDRILEEELFFELEQALDSRNRGAESSHEPVEPASLELAPEDGSEAETEPVLREASPEPEPPASAAGQEELAIVGQYESEGTSYIMYSDGSIEARTEHAVFHFKSMAELRAFMETSARTSQE